MKYRSLKKVHEKEMKTIPYTIRSAISLEREKEREIGIGIG